MAGETVEHSNETVASKSFRRGRTISTEHTEASACIAASRIVEAQRAEMSLWLGWGVIHAKKTETSLGLDRNVVVIVITQQTVSSLRFGRNVVVVTGEGRNLEEIS